MANFNYNYNYNYNYGYSQEPSDTAIVAPPSPSHRNNFFLPGGRRVFPSPIHNISSRRVNWNTPTTRVKRRSSDVEESSKKVKHPTAMRHRTNIPAENLTLQNMDVGEYPKFEHPEGGIIQFTPVGNIRTFVSDNNVVQRIVEKNSSFDLSKTDRGIDGYKLFLGKNGFATTDDCSPSKSKPEETCIKGVYMDTSPSNEIEGYMRAGYSDAVANNTSYYQDGETSAAKLSFYLDDDDDDDDYDDGDNDGDDAMVD
ncbi:DEKNAAC100426 [Brettanomyces naardenensis]|uniref:DEKNAAC100426 n=1 Tax=Brettanomyces naardenensis TaxID=13370 RepID=A0A448YEI6_BRENA|nr:DEKNAAC100426 [Brettanomyces naardenensis]